MREKISSHDLRQNSILRINDRKTLQLIHEYKKEPCLWNSSLDDYPNKNKRQRAADKIAKILNIKNFEGKHVLIKFKNLRNSYSQELKKIKYSMDKVGANSPLMYKPKVQWFPLMDSFIRPHLQTSKLFSKEQNLSDIVTNVKMECYEDDWSEPQVDSEPAANYSQSEGHSENEEISDDSRAKRRRRRSNSSGPSTTPGHQDPQDNFNQNQIFLTSDVTPVTMGSRTEDTYDNFAKYIASLLRNLPPQKALRLQPKIVDMIVSVSVEEENNVMVEINKLGESATE